MKYGVVSREWPGATVACLATGPSLCQADVDAVRGMKVIAVNDAYLLAPWADVLYSGDAKWWAWKRGVPGFAGQRWSIESHSSRRKDWPGLRFLRNTGSVGLEMDPSGLRTGAVQAGGGNSGYQAINLAANMGASRIVLLGYDMQGDHFFGSHPDKSRPHFPACIEGFSSLVQPLADLGIEIVNCTRKTALTAFPRDTLESVLAVAA